jgi:hypothetical protein
MGTHRSYQTDLILYFFLISLISLIYRNNLEKSLDAQVQHITFNEFLPRVLGRDQLATFGLDLSPGYYEKYDPQCSVQTFNEFSSAAFR